MKKLLMWIIPTVFIICCLVVYVILSQLNLNFELIDFIFFIVATYGILLISPCLYIFLINKYSNDIKSLICSILYSIGCITLNAIIICYDSLLYYFGIRERNIHDLNLFSAYIIIPFGIIIIGICIIIVLKLINNTRRQKE